MTDKVHIANVNYLNVAEGKLAGMKLENGTVEVAEAILKQVQQAMPADQLGYDKVDITATVACNGDDLELGIRYDIKVDTEINLLARLYEFVHWLANSEYAGDEDKDLCKKWDTLNWN